MGSLPYRGGRLHRRRGLHFCLLLCSEITETLKLTRVSNVQCMRANPVYRLIKFCESLEGLFLSRNYATCLSWLKATPSQTKKVFILLHGYRRTVLHAALLQRLLWHSNWKRCWRVQGQISTSTGTWATKCHKPYQQYAQKKQNIGRWKVWVALVLEWIEMVVSGKYSW